MRSTATTGPVYYTVDMCAKARKKYLEWVNSLGMGRVKPKFDEVVNLGPFFMKQGSDYTLRPPRARAARAPRAARTHGESRKLSHDDRASSVTCNENCPMTVSDSALQRAACNAI